MKKFFACLLAVLLAGCGFSAVRAAAEAPRPLSIVCSTFPSYDWVRQILGEDADGVSLTLLVDDGADLHNYQPTVADIAAIQGCDLFVYVGGESDGWAESILAASPQTHTLALLDWVDTREEETVEGLEHDDRWWACWPGSWARCGLKLPCAGRKTRMRISGSCRRWMSNTRP